MTFAFSTAVLATIAGVTAWLLPRHPGVIAGEVTDETSQGIVAVQVSVDQDCRTITGPQGEFMLTSVEHGEHVLRASSPGFAPFEDTVMVRAGDTLRLAIALVPQMTRQERDSARAGIVAILSVQPEPQAGEQWWIRECH